jgi:hypothetical protein
MFPPSRRPSNADIYSQDNSRSAHISRGIQSIYADATLLPVPSAVIGVAPSTHAARCFTFPRPVTIPRVFLTLCAGGKYTSKFRMLPGLWQAGWTEKTPKPTRQLV